MPTAAETLADVLAVPHALQLPARPLRRGEQAVPSVVPVHLPERHDARGDARLRCVYLQRDVQGLRFCSKNLLACAEKAIDKRVSIQNYDCAQ